ncbi:amino acid adenylation domain-containing protein, partial [Methanobrevibacter sp.]|uniref:amino acid adenylation domain-containing protein n=1 Tax=Methanobrevibacter sp. TaxID=66852 RepID=UPI00388DA95D
KTTNPNVEITPDHTAYMIYTSGSTGKPKGVIIGHENACNEAEGNPKCKYNSILSIATIAFDTSLEDILTGITNGIKIIFANDNEIKNIVDLVQLIKQNRPEVMEFTPSRLLSYLEVKEFCEVIDCAKCIVMGGEQFSAKAFTGVKQYTDAKVYNSYGPTETTIASSYKEIKDPENITIGKALQNYITEVRDIDGKLLPQGVMGELYIGGTGVGKGYYNMPEKTKEVFLEINNIPYYRSGDYAIETTDGEIDIKGRIDNQIKLRGLRIEIGEIETNIGKYPNIKQNIVVIKEINNNDHLCAYFTAEQQINTDDLKDFLKDKLTKYMIPTVFMQIDEIPQTPNGKTDLKKLPKPILKLENVKPENETEEKLFEIASELINTNEFGVTDDLYKIGYTSLTLMKLNTLIYKEMDVNLDISVLFNNPTIKKLAYEVLNNGDKQTSIDKFIESSKEMEYYPLTENQLGVYYECKQNPNDIMYVIPMLTRFNEDIDADKLKTAITKTIDYHPYLKTRIIRDSDGEIKLKRLDEVLIEDIEIVEVENIDEDQIIENDIKAFKLDNDQLFHFKIYKSENEVALFSNFHHIITDGESQENLFKEIVDVYEGKELEEEKVNGYVLSLIEKNYEESEKYETSKKFFHDKLMQDIESTILTPNLSGNPDDGKSQELNRNLEFKSIKKFCKDNSISQNVLIMASAIIGLNKFTFSDKALITTIFNGRANPNYYNTQGFLVKTLPLIVTAENREITIKEFLKQIDETWKDTINSSYYPYTKIADEFQLKPEFFYAYHESSESEIESNSLNYYCKELNHKDVKVTEYKTNLNVVDDGEKIELSLEYNDQLYTEEYAEKFLDSILHILNQIIASDMNEFRLCDIELEKPKEIPEFEPMEIPFIHKRFEKQANEHPNNTAIISSGKSISYGELDQKANRVANALIKKGVEPGNKVLVILPRDINLIAAIMGILKAGCAYIPIDMEYPLDRIKYIYENSQADYMITDGSTGNSLDISRLIEEEDMSTPDVDITPDDLAYMIYTSGSTGNPKGVMISHRNIANLFAESDDNIIYEAYTKMHKTLAITTISFDTFLLDFNALTFGLEMVLANDIEMKNIEDLTRLIHKEKPDALTFTTPSRLMQYLDYDKFTEELSTFKYLAVGGEILPKELVSKVVANSEAEIFNIYGPTETTVTCNSISIRDPEKISVGKALHNYVTDVRDIDGKLLPQGVMGELYIGGVGVGKGYYNLEEKTKEVFIEINGIPYYRSGDYAIELPNGEIDIKGRIDNQIKLRGLRIEIGEIESNISRFPHVKQNVVLIKKINDTEHLCAYITADEKLDINLLRRYLENKLTKYMIPSAFMQIDEMPQTPNGKTDIKQLPEPELSLNHDQPETETEKKLFELVKSVSTTEEFGVSDDLYTLGFTSLTLMKLNSLIYKNMNVNLDMASLFNDPTVRNLADSIDNYIATSIDLDEIMEKAKNMEYFPLTDNQLGIYYECIQELSEIKYTMPTAIRFDDNIDPYKLKEAIIIAIDAHPYLKTRIINTDSGELKQKRCDDEEIENIEIVELDVDITPEEIMKNDVKAIPINNHQLFRFKIYNCPNNTWLFSDFHHIITDGVSQDNIFNDITKAYESGHVKSEKIDGYVYSLIEQENYENEVSEKYFKNKLGDGIESTVLTTNLNGNPEEGEIKLVEDSIDSTFIRHFCNDHSISPNVLFMTATIINLNKFTYSDKTLITTIFNGRANSDFYDTQGMLVKTIPIMINSENREMFIEDFIKMVDKSWKNSLIHSNYPYTKISQTYQLKPEFFYAYHESFEKDQENTSGINFESIPLDGTVATDYKINFNIYNDGETIALYLEYNDQLYTQEYIEKFMYCFKYTLIQFIVNDLDKFRLCDFELENDLGLHEFEEVKIPFIHKRFEKQVDEKPDRIALIASDRTLTYKELENRSNRIANALIKKGIKPKSKILIMLPRTSDLISAIFGVLKSGCAYIPIDLEYPEERIRYIYENSEADYIIAQETSQRSLGIEDLLKEENTERPDVYISPDDLAYLIYTSGSTGKPKGVMTTHKNIANLFAESDSNIVYEAYSKMRKTLAISTVSFDAFLLDLNALTFGSEMVLANDNAIKSIEELTRLIQKEKPDSLTFATPSRLLQYLDYDQFAKELSAFKYVGVGGEMLPKELINKVMAISEAEIFNIYGPTETTVTCNSTFIRDPENINVGKALHNYVTEVRDIDGKLLPQGVMGELYIGGFGVAKGYYNMPEKTKDTFITINDIPYYRSGDYAIELPNGEISIKGRIDNQIKLRGLRIEIGEIETNISEYPNIKKNVVLIREINNTEHLCAYYTASENIDKDDLKEYLKGKLTRYMVPTVFMQLDEMPQTPNGKTDIKQLPEPKIDMKYVAPQTPLEQLICAVFSKTLDIETVGAEDNFFEIGGTSLIASKLIMELVKRDYSISYEDIFQNQTPQELAKFLSGEADTKDLHLDLLENYDYTRINELLSENTLENFHDGELEELGNVLITGVTGFLGIHVLYEFLKNENGIAYCMLRKGNYDSCKDRLSDLVEYYFDEDLTDLIDLRVELIEGDITEINDFKKLVDQPIDTIVNCAAIVKHYSADDYIFRVNVDGVINGLEFAKANNIKFVQVSTVSVLTYPRDETISVEFDERSFYYSQDLTNKYVNSKFLAERKVLEYAANGLDVKIVRVGNLMGRYYDGKFQKNYETNAFLNNLKALVKIKSISESIYNDEVEMSPINMTAKSLLALSKTPAKCRVFNCNISNIIHNYDIIEVLNSFGYEIEKVSNKEFVEICKNNMDENIQGLITSETSIDDEEPYEEYVNNEQTRTILHELNVDWPEIDKEYLKRVITYLNKVNFFD